jgi:hypothetical protein
MGFCRKKNALFASLIVHSGDIKTSINLFETPVQAAIRYNKGGRWVQEFDDPEVLRRALVFLDQSKEIYLRNDRRRSAAYAATLAAEGRLKLAAQNMGGATVLSEARDLLDFAFREFDPSQNNDRGMLAFAKCLEEKLNALILDAVKRLSENVNKDV